MQLLSFIHHTSITLLNQRTPTTTRTIIMPSLQQQHKSHKLVFGLANMLLKLEPKKGMPSP
jgi:hypothetical protein